MNIFKALKFIERHSLPEYTKDIKDICSDIGRHLNKLADEFIEKDKEIERLRGEVEKYKDLISYADDKAKYAELESKYPNHDKQTKGYFEGVSEAFNEMANQLKRIENEK